MADTRVVPGISAGNLLRGSGDILAPVAVVAVVMMLIIPLPTVLLDALMAANLVLSLLILLTVVYTRRVTDFSQFPTVLLVATLFGLALNVSSTRLILTQGERFGGHMIRAFSSFVTGGGGAMGLVIGFVIFVIITVVQVVVITSGSKRIAEVTARFSLDSMSNKYMAIDVEFNHGAIDEKEAMARRTALQQEIQFYGNMDGASRFISNNVKAGIFITVVNILGGIIIGAAVHGEPVSSAFGTYIAFAIGDGLLSQFPALLISSATGLIVTRSLSSGSFSEDMGREFTRYPMIYWIAAGFILILSFVPGFPWYVLIPLSGLLAFMAFRMTREAGKAKAEEDEAAKDEDKKKAGDDEDKSPVVPLDPLSLEVGYGLIPLVDQDKGAELLARVKRIRQELAAEFGLVIPKIRITDNLALEPSEYCFKIKGIEMGRSKIRMAHYLCINAGGLAVNIPGERTVDPAFGLPALWIDEEHRAEAERAGLTVVDPPSIIATHIQEIIKNNAAEILGRQDTQRILDTLKKDYPAVVEEAQKVLTLGQIQKVLQSLLREQVSIRSIVEILEALADWAPVSKNIPFLTERARQALGRQICLQYADETRTIHALTIEPSLEKTIIDSALEQPSGWICGLQPEVRIKWLSSLARQVSMMKAQGWVPPIVVCSEQARPIVKQSTERADELPELVVLSVREIVDDVKLVAVGVVALS